ncbi:MAG: aminotransferase class V-fold PLP-dependent enzyme [bacterium]|nr:aminotransferase class V-fold PLP-dependent enzyme [bacterium]
MNKKNWKFDTKAIQSGFNQDDKTGSTTLPIYASAAFSYDTAQEISDVFDGRAFGHIYSRISNPTVAHVEQRIAALDNGIGAALFSTGMAAIAAIATSLTKPGDNIIVSESLFGGTQDYFETTLAKYNVEVREVNPNDLLAIENAIDDRTQMVFFEVISNPRLDVPDFTAIHAITQKAGVPLIADSTMATPYLFDGKLHGADVVVHSATKYFSGASGVLGGAVIDVANFNWKTCKSEEVAEAAKQFGQFGFLSRVRWHGLHNQGSTPSPYNAFFINLGLETLALRLERHSSNALALAHYLESHPKIKSVNYPGLPSHGQHDLASRQFNQTFGGMLTFELYSKEAAFAFIDALNMVKNMANLGDTKTILIHPHSTIYLRRGAASVAAAGITPEMIRCSVGIESPDDIIADFEQALGTLND